MSYVPTLEDLGREVRRLTAERDAAAKHVQAYAERMALAEREKTVTECIDRIGTLLIGEETRRYLTQALLPLAKRKDAT